MIKLRHVFPSLCLATSLAALAADAATAAAPGADVPSADVPAAAVGGPHWHRGHGGPGGMGFVLHKLNPPLTTTEKAAIKTIFTDYKSQLQTLHASIKSNRQALAATPPTDSSYATLVQTAQTNAKSRIALETEIWTAIYKTLSIPQQQSIPGIVAAAQAARQSKIDAWKAAHPQSP